VLGIGLNVNIDPEALGLLSPNCTSLSIELGAEVQREKLVVDLFKAVDMWYRGLQRDPDVIFEAWSTGLDTLGKAVQVRDVAGLWQGVAMQVRRDGSLTVRKDNGEVHVVYAADVSVRPSQGFTSAQ
jgi:BirA family biotin operon repressor/biotin-[acetyl-CoA-carboxylase] ligase